MLQVDVALFSGSSAVQHYEPALCCCRRRMHLRIAHTLSLMFVAILLGASLAHVFALPNKIGLERDAYLTVQQIYRGWALLGFVVGVALISTLSLTVLLGSRSPGRLPVLAAFLCLGENPSHFLDLDLSGQCSDQ
jgi:hypothetical protein